MPRPFALLRKHGKYKDAACTEEDLKKGEPKGKYEKTGGPKFTGEGGAGVLHARIRKCEIEEEGVKGWKASNYRAKTAAALATQNTTPMAKALAAQTTLRSNAQASTRLAKRLGVTKLEMSRSASKVVHPSVSRPRRMACPREKIKTDSLKGRLGYISKATHEVGVLLEPSTAGGEFAEFEALEGDILEHVGVGNATAGAAYGETGPGNPTGHDGVMSPITPVGQMTHTFTQNYRAEEDQQPCPQAMCQKPELPSWINVPSRFEGGQLEALETFFKVPVDTPEFTTESSPAAEEVTNVNTVEGNAEIKG